MQEINIGVNPKKKQYLVGIPSQPDVTDRAYIVHTTV